LKTVLIVYHSQYGHTAALAEAAAKGAGMVENVRVVVKRAVEATLADLMECDGLIIGSPEYFGFMAGMVKDFFDRTYRDAEGVREVFRKPYAVFISAGNDGDGALRSIERICRGYRFKKVCEAVIVKGDVDETALALCEELGQTLAAGCEAGIF
jgi:multimeric flavodoxin WrbA